MQSANILRRRDTEGADGTDKSGFFFISRGNVVI